MDFNKLNLYIHFETFVKHWFIQNIFPGDHAPIRAKCPHMFAEILCWIWTRFFLKLSHLWNNGSRMKVASFEAMKAERRWKVTGRPLFFLGQHRQGIKAAKVTQSYGVGCVIREFELIPGWLTIIKMRKSCGIYFSPAITNNNVIIGKAAMGLGSA